MRTILIGILFLILTNSVKAQSCCSGGTPLTGNLSLKNIASKQWYLRVGYDYNYLNDLIADNQLLNNNTRNRITQSILLHSSYGISDKIAVSGLFSFVNEAQSTFSPGRTNKVSQSGLGDAFVLLQYSIFSTVQHELLWSAGPKIPIGKTNARDEQGILLPPDLQPGSGSWDFVTGVSYRKFHLFGVPTLNFNISGGYKYSGNSTRFEGDDGYRFGNEFIALASVSKGILLRKTEVVPTAQFAYRNTLPDEIHDFDLPSTGGNWYNFNPSIQIIPSDFYEISIGGEIPIYRNLTGTQLTTTYRFNFGISLYL